MTDRFFADHTPQRSGAATGAGETGGKSLPHTRWRQHRLVVFIGSDRHSYVL